MLWLFASRTAPTLEALRQVRNPHLFKAVARRRQRLGAALALELARQFVDQLADAPAGRTLAGTREPL